MRVEQWIGTRGAWPVTFTYDGGNRISRTEGGVTTKFLVDDQNPTGYSQVLEEWQGSTMTQRFTLGYSRDLPPGDAWR